ncbi:MAG TPA: porin [Thermoanaerobaculia bacterium]|nr:porin [Thermoanaerobaculia bacterium]
MEDGALFSQNAASVSQVGALPDVQEFRASRLELDGQMKAPFAWSFKVNAGDNGLDENQRGSELSIAELYVAVPLTSWATINVGEQEAGVGMERLTHGEDLSFMERSTMTEAYKKAHSLGIRFTGTAAGGRMTWSAGWFNNWLTDGLSFSAIATVTPGA